MSKTLKFYFKAVQASIKAQMQYRFSFIVNTLTYCIVILCDILPVFIMMYHFKSLGGWNIYQVAALWGCVNIAVSFIKTFCVEIRLFQNYIVDGSFDTLLLRPWPTLLLLMSKNIRYFKLSGVIQGFIVLLLALVKLQVNYITFLYLPIIIVTSTITLFALEVIIASLSFWFGRTGELNSMLSYAPTYAAMHPNNIYPRTLRVFMLVWPVSFLGYLQLSHLFGLGYGRWVLYVAPIVAMVALFGALKVWAIGEKCYYSTGS
ncbi:ABC-2 family transporter protein [Clostridium sp. 'deep sea']|uniref:ABC transporter permease n=1 Tax=Clostridium sp. 'deep sea' TaxID=2779445 RepID=UPI00189650BC|nr:ABC-2 family transporter protein [Clostridium sp. 'deep sea']QOR34015.1 ABC-2 family transporter protein [Clostridium sp. 'deep sea']